VRSKVVECAKVGRTWESRREREKVDQNEKVTKERDCKKVSKDNIMRERMWDGVNVCKSLW